MDELTGAPKTLKGAGQNDLLALRSLINTLNDPSLTGANMPPEERAAANQLLQAGQAVPGAAPTGQSAAVVEKPISSATPAPAVIAPKAALTRVFLTGRAGGPDEIATQSGATVISMKRLVEAQMTRLFGVTPSPAIVQEFRAWASGVVNPQYPQGLTRILLESLIRKNYPNFGEPDYWLNWVKSQADSAIESRKAVIVVGVEDVSTFQLLRKAGFVHYHVMLSNVTASAKSLVPNALSEALDNDVIKKISVQRDGPRLHVVWNDDQPSPSGRFYSVSDFNREFASEVIAEGEVQVI